MSSRRTKPAAADHAADSAADQAADQAAPDATAPAPAAPAPVPQDPQTGGRFERLPDGSLRRLD